MVAPERPVTQPDRPWSSEPPPLDQSAPQAWLLFCLSRSYGKGYLPLRESCPSAPSLAFFHKEKKRSPPLVSFFSRLLSSAPPERILSIISIHGNIGRDLRRKKTLCYSVRRENLSSLMEKYENNGNLRALSQRGQCASNTSLRRREFGAKLLFDVDRYAQLRTPASCQSAFIASARRPPSDSTSSALFHLYCQRSAVLKGTT